MIIPRRYWMQCIIIIVDTQQRWRRHPDRIHYYKQEGCLENGVHPPCNKKIKKAQILLIDQLVHCTIQLFPLMFCVCTVQALSSKRWVAFTPRIQKSIHRCPVGLHYSLTCSLTPFCLLPIQPLCPSILVLVSRKMSPWHASPIISIPTSVSITKRVKGQKWERGSDEIGLL